MHAGARLMYFVARVLDMGGQRRDMIGTTAFFALCFSICYLFSLHPDIAFGQSIYNSRRGVFLCNLYSERESARICFGYLMVKNKY